MLLQFSVENYRSFHGEEILNMIPVKSRIHPRHVLKSEEKGRKVRGLPLAIFYGANASGKSNLVKAMAFAQRLIVQGTRSEAQTGAIAFRLADSAAQKASRFEFVFKYQDVLYTYGFSATQKEITEEWLFGVFQKQEVRIFERKTENGAARMEFGAHLASTKEEKQRLQFVAAGTRQNQLFLTEANERNVAGLKPAMHWFRDHLTIIWPESLYQPLLMRVHSDKRFADFLATFLSTADTGIQGIDLKAEKLDTERQFSALPDEVLKALVKNLEQGLEQSSDHAVLLSTARNSVLIRRGQDKIDEFLTLRTEHHTSDGSAVYFDSGDESDGTLRMMHIIPALLDLQSAEKVYVIDELDRSLHPHLCNLYIKAFLRGVIEKGHRGQLILTTHETSLLDLDLLRRDEIWFVEKDKQGASHLTSLAEFKYKVRADLKVDKGYLNGRFGAIPFLGDVEQLYK